jgi:hypothetical protein
MSVIAVDFLWGTAWTSKAIGMFGFPQGPSHCASVLQDGRYLDARDGKIAGVPAGVRIRRPEIESFAKKQRATLQVTPAEYADWEANLRAKVTTSYDRRAILGFLEDRSVHTAGQWICSALFINGVQHISRKWTPPHTGYVPFPLPVPAHEISPASAMLIIATAGWTFEPMISGTH